MNNINLNLRKKLNKLVYIKLPKIINTKISIDGTIKWLLCVNNDYIETVFIPDKNRNTLCISTQVGCSMGCFFCETSKNGFIRNLNVSEIIGQVLLVFILIKKKIIKTFIYITNIVFMGMGEPLLNFYNVINSIKIMLDKFGFYFSKRKIVISTSGIVPNIYKLIKFVDVVLTISLHASNDILRSKIMPINNKYNINLLFDSINFYVKKSKANKGFFNIEYIMIKNINDNIINAYELVNLLKNIPSKVNLIPFNETSNSIFNRSIDKKIYIFKDVLIKNNIFCYIRKVRGFDIKASCGQLSNIVK